MSQNSKWAAWQQLVAKQEDNEVSVVISYDPGSDQSLIVDGIVIDPTITEIDPTQTIDLEPVTTEETGLEYTETPYADTVEDRQIPDKTTGKPKKGNKA